MATRGGFPLRCLLLLALARAWTSPGMGRNRRRPRAVSQPSASIGGTDPSHAAPASDGPEGLAALLQDLQHHPKLIVFDLDNTLWTPELYQIRQPHPPVADRDIRLFDHVGRILAHCRAAGYALGVASRTSKVQWAHRLLQDFGVALDDDGQDRATAAPLATFFEFVEIEPGSKKTHFANLRRASGHAYGDMVFFDDDLHMNLQEISTQLGVFCVHTPRGITAEHFARGLRAFDERKRAGQEWMGEIVTGNSLGISSGAGGAAGRRCQGRVKFYSAAKKFGFVVDAATRREYFVHESKVPAGIRLSTGGAVTFDAVEAGRPYAVILGNGGASGEAWQSSPTETATAKTPTVSMPCFTMSQPFCSLLLNGVKTVESRNNPMFMDIAPGTKLLVHCGQKDWHDTKSYRDILAREMTSQAIDDKSQLPEGFDKGAIVGVITVGKTWKASDAERNEPSLQRKVLAPCDGIGSFCTEILSYQWLEKPVRMRGQPGVYTARVPAEAM